MREGEGEYGGGKDEDELDVSQEEVRRETVWIDIQKHYQYNGGVYIRLLLS